MRPLVLVAIGLGIVAIDIRTEYFDLLPDPAGWGLVALGAWWLSDNPFAAWAAAATALLSSPEVSLPYRWVKVQVPVPGGGFEEHQLLVFEDLTGWRLALVPAATATGGVALWLLLGSLASRAAAWGRRTTATQLRWLRWLVLVGWIGPYLGVVAVSGLGDERAFDPVWNGALEYLALAGVAIVTALVLVLLREANRAWAVPSRSNPLSPQLRRAGPRNDGRPSA